MALALDGLDVLRRIGSNPSAFPALRTKLGKLRSDLAAKAESLVKKQIKDKGLALESFRALVDVLGGDDVSLVFEQLSSTELAGLVKKLDKYHSSFSDTAMIKRHLIDLGRRRVEPAAKPAEPPKNLVKQFKDRGLTLEGFRRLVSTSSDSAVSVSFEILKPAELKAIARRLDPHHPNLKADDSSWPKRHLIDLAHHQVEPLLKSEMATSPLKSRSKSQRQRTVPIDTSAMRARRG